MFWCFDKLWQHQYKTNKCLSKHTNSFAIKNSKKKKYVTTNFTPNQSSGWHLSWPLKIPYPGATGALLWRQGELPWRENLWRERCQRDLRCVLFCWEDVRYTHLTRVATKATRPTWKLFIVYTTVDCHVSVFVLLLSPPRQSLLLHVCGEVYLLWGRRSVCQTRCSARHHRRAVPGLEGRHGCV